MESLTRKILSMPREQVFEAVLAFKSSFPLDEVDRSEQTELMLGFLEEVQRTPFRHVDEVEQVARTFLLALACDQEFVPRIEAIVIGTGRKNFIFGGTELVLAGQTAVLALALVLSWWKNRKAEDSIKVEIDSEGKWSILCGKETLYQNRGRIGELISAISACAERRVPAGFRAFISYRRKSDSETARAIRAELKSRNLRAFLDVDDLGRAAFDDQILRRIEETPNFIVILSPGTLDRSLSDETDWVRREVSHAFQTHRNVIPVLRDGFQFPVLEALPLDLANLPRMQAITYSHNFFEAAIDKLVTFLL